MESVLKDHSTKATNAITVHVNESCSGDPVFVRTNSPGVYINVDGKCIATTFLSSVTICSGNFYSSGCYSEPHASMFLGCSQSYLT